jgi:hypothetical protein
MAAKAASSASPAARKPSVVGDPQLVVSAWLEPAVQERERGDRRGDGEGAPCRYGADFSPLTLSSPQLANRLAPGGKVSCVAVGSVPS